MCPIKPLGLVVSWGANATMHRMSPLLMVCEQVIVFVSVDMYMYRCSLNPFLLDL